MIMAAIERARPDWSEREVCAAGLGVAIGMSFTTTELTPELCDLAVAEVMAMLAEEQELTVEAELARLPRGSA